VTNAPIRRPASAAENAKPPNASPRVSTAPLSPPACSTTLLTFRPYAPAFTTAEPAAEVKKRPKSKAAAKPKATKAAAGKKSSGKAGKDPNAPKRGLSA